MNQAISITIEGTIWELIGKGVVSVLAVVLALFIGNLLFLAWGMGGWRPWNFITDWIHDRRMRREDNDRSGSDG